MKLNELQFVFAKNVAKLINHIFENGYYCSLGECYRTKEQAEIYAKEAKGIIDSQHCKKLAIDLSLFSPDGQFLIRSEDYEWLGKYWKILNSRNRWGGDFSNITDGNHFEMYDGN